LGSHFPLSQKNAGTKRLRGMITFRFLPTTLIMILREIQHFYEQIMRGHDDIPP